MSKVIEYKDIKIEYHAVGDTWCQQLLRYGKWSTELKIVSFIY